ncbi:MAG: glutathione S-transferase family protein [Alphaproteobacteria bacterium]|nr:glutathione S-transferase family protein [Alphaproteobacteria bacterium]MCW5741248.1 glutathione S-transferase family protein [Alphaproteobacteria bacterium]
MSMRLFSGPLSMFGAKAEIAALEKGLDVKVEMVAFDMKALYEPKHPEVLRVNPKRQVPVLIDGDLEIFDSTQIFEYFEEIRPQPPLWPTSVKGRARARLLEMKSDEVFFPHIIRLMGLQRSLDEPAAVTAIAAAIAYDREMEALLADDREYLAGDFSYADIAFYMAQFFADRLGAPMPADVGRLLAWRERMTARPAVRQVATAMARFLVSVGGRKPGFIAV